MEAATHDECPPHTVSPFLSPTLPTSSDWADSIPGRKGKKHRIRKETPSLKQNPDKKSNLHKPLLLMSHKQGAAETVRVQICISSQISSSLPLLATYAADRFIRAISPPHLSTNGTGREDGIHLAKKKFASVCRVPPTSNPRIASRNAVCLPPSCHFCKPASSSSSNRHSPTVGREMATCQTGAPCGGGRRRAKMGGC